MSRQARVGLLVFAGFVLFALALFVLANRTFLFSDTFFVQSQYSRVSGLKAGGAVQFQGVNVGRVQSVQLPSEPGGKITVTMAIQDQARHLVHSKTEAQIKTDGLVGNMLVVLVNPPEAGDVEAIDEGDVIAGVDPFDVFEITDKAVASVQRFEGAAVAFESIMHDVKEGKGTLGKIIYDPELYNSMVQTARETEQLMASLGDDAEALVDLAGEATQGVESILQKIDEGEGTLARMINDPAIYNTVLSTADTLQTVASNLQVLAANLENFSNWGTIGAFRFAELMEAGKHNWMFKRYFEERGNMNLAPFEGREAAIADGWRKMQEKEQELAAWEARLQAQAARIDSLNAATSLGDAATPTGGNQNN